MNRRARKISYLVVLILFSLMVSACSDPIITENDNQLNTKSPENVNKVNLKFTYWGSPDEKKAIEEAAARFTKRYPWISVETIQLPGSEYNTKLITMAAANDLPDTGYMNGDLGDAWAKQNRFINLFDMFNQDADIKRDDYLDNIWYQQSPDYAWGVSTAGESFGLFYRKDLLASAGVETPPTKAENAWTWEQFVENAKKLTIDKNGHNAAHPDFDPKQIKQYGVTFETWNEPINNFIFSNGGDWLTEDGKEFALNDPKATDAIQKLADLINVHHVAPSPLTAKSLPAMNVALQSGITAMAIGGQWMNLDLGNAKVNYDIGVLPKLKKSLTVGVSGATVIFKESKHPEEAWLLFKWMSNPENAIELYSSGLWMPTMKKWYTDPDLIARWVDANPAAHPPGFKEAMMLQFLHNSVPGSMYYLKNLAKINSIVFSGLDIVWMGQMNAQDAMNGISREIKPFIQGRYDRK
ncbi:sugar ABC transporter substrate-binding protein [Paenibacillus oryzisoli]|uniref:ABC transporter substrate-binding protein n=1 Tax=Paenibacillus oryzisoli TaxID=1850517 RepID=UPI003D27577A